MQWAGLGWDGITWSRRNSDSHLTRNLPCSCRARSTKRQTRSNAARRSRRRKRILVIADGSSSRIFLVADRPLTMHAQRCYRVSLSQIVFRLSPECSTFFLNLLKILLWRDREVRWVRASSTEEKAKRARSRKIANEVRYKWRGKKQALVACRLPFRLSETRAIRRQEWAWHYLPCTPNCSVYLERAEIKIRKRAFSHGDCVTGGSKDTLNPGRSQPWHTLYWSKIERQPTGTWRKKNEEMIKK